MPNRFYKCASKKIMFKVIFSVKNKKSRIHGLGAYALEKNPAKRKIGPL
jgi:hypothetical protein